MITDKKTLEAAVRKAVAEVPITDVHTHVFTPCFGDQLLYGPDELVTYHYLIAEFFRYSDMAYDDFFALPKKEQADLIWNELFVKRSPISEAERGVLTTWKKLGLDTSSKDINTIRKFWDNISKEEYIDLVFKTSGVESVVMTNDPFTDAEYEVWVNGTYEKDDRFKAALRIDQLLINWENLACGKLQEWGYKVEKCLTEVTLAEIRRFLAEWADKMEALYMAASLPPTFRCPDDTAAARILEGAVIPVCEEKNLPFAMMIGTKRQVNPGLRLAGDSVGKADLNTLDYLCSTYPHCKFMLTLLSKEAQHEAAVTARKFRNLLLFGCWWFLNNPSIIDEMTRMRIELLGLSVIPQHSDARVLDQLIYKWTHSKALIADVLVDKYNDLFDTGWAIGEEDITKDVAQLFGGAFWDFLAKKF